MHGKTASIVWLLINRPCTTDTLASVSLYMHRLHTDTAGMLCILLTRHTAFYQYRDSVHASPTHIIMEVFHSEGSAIMLHAGRSSDLLSSGGLLSPVVGAPGITGLASQRRPQDPGTVDEDHTRGQQACSLQPPGGHRHQGEDECQHQREGDEKDVEATAGVGRPELVHCPNDDQGAAVADKGADDQHPAHILLQHQHVTNRLTDACVQEHRPWMRNKKL